VLDEVDGVDVEVTEVDIDCEAGGVTDAVDVELLFDVVKTATPMTTIAIIKTVPKIYFVFILDVV